jgi:exopolysaccharide production protein ExoQ
MSQIATFVYIVGILGLFVLDRKGTARISKACWLPIVWLLINGSRPVSLWLQIEPRNLADQSLEGNPLDRNIYLGLIIAGAIVLWGRQTTVVRLLRANPSILLFLVFCALSVSWSDYPDVAFKRWIKFLGDLVMVLIVISDPQRLSAIKRVLSTVAFILIPTSVLLIKYYPEMARYYSRWEGTMFVSGVAVDKNMLGMTCLVFGLGAWWQLLGAWREKGRERRRRLIAHGAILTMVLWLFWMANSATSGSCFVMAGGLMAITSVVRAARKPAVLHFLVAAVLCASVSVLFLDIGGGALHALGRNSTLTGRTEIWKGLLDFSGNPLFGTGFESFWVGERLRKIWATGGLLYGINESHNGYLEVFLNEGWIGLTLLAAIIVGGYREIVRAVRRDPQTHCLNLAYFVAVLVYNLTEAAFKAVSPMWFVFVWAVIDGSAESTRGNKEYLVRHRPSSETSLYDVRTADLLPS